MNVIPIESKPLAQILGVESPKFDVKFDDNFNPLSLRVDGGKINLIHVLYEDEVQMLSDAVRHFAIQSIASFNILNSMGIVSRC